MRSFDFSSWQGILTTILGLAVFTLIGVGIRVLMMLTLQQRQQRMNRQINERLRTLIAAYKTLGGSFTGELSVDPTHLRDLRLRVQDERGEVGGSTPPSGPERPRRIRDMVEAALSDIILLGTEDHVRLAARAARDMAEGKAVRTDELVVSLRDYIRKALDLGPVPSDAVIPLQGPTRQERGANKGGKGGASGGGGGGMGGMGGMGGGMGGGGMGLGLGTGGHSDKN